MRTVLSTFDAGAAQRAVARLAAIGIRAHTYGSDSAFAGTLAGGSYTVVVAPEDGDRAEAALRAAPAAREPRPWTCPQCAEVCEGVFDACWQCGAARAGSAAAPAAEEPTAAEPAAEERDKALTAPLPQPAVHRDLDPRSDGLARRWFETGCVLWFGWWLSFAWTFADASGSAPASTTAWEGMFADHGPALGNCFLVVLIVWSGRAWALHGLVRPRLLVDVGIAIVLYALTLGTMQVVVMTAYGTGIFQALDGLWEPCDPEVLLPPQMFPGTATSQVVLQRSFEMWYWLVMAANEELTYRAFLLPRLGELLRSRLAATLISTTLFAANHAYQGAFAVLWTFAFGLLMAGGFWITGRVWPLVLAHAFSNFLG